MPGAYKIDQKENLVTIRSTGIVTVDEKIAQDEAIIADPCYRSNMNIICDLSDATYDWSLADIDKFRSYLRRISGHAEKSKWAVVASSGKSEHTAKIFSVLLESSDSVIKVKVMRNREKALEWLREPD